MVHKRNLPGSLLLILLSGLIIISCNTAPSDIVTAQENPSIVSVGTGFFISDDGYLVTSEHVISGARVIGVWVDGIRYRADVIAEDADSDVAILKINHRPSHYFYLASNINVGDRVNVLGFPMTNILGSEIRLTEGIVNSLTGYDGDPRVFQMSALSIKLNVTAASQNPD